MGFSLAVVHVSWNGRYLSGLLMNRRGKKICTAIAYPFFDGEREWDEGFTWCYTSFLWGKRAAPSLPAPSWRCLWGFCCFPVQFCARTNRHQLKDPLRFFLLFFPPPAPWSCFPGSLSHALGFPGSVEREAQLWESYFIFFPLSCCFLKLAISEVRAGNEGAERSGVPGEC